MSGRGSPDVSPRPLREAKRAAKSQSGSEWNYVTCPRSFSVPFQASDDVEVSPGREVDRFLVEIVLVCALEYNKDAKTNPIDA